MKCPACGREHDNEKSDCPFCEVRMQLVGQRSKEPAKSAMSIAAKSIGMCPECGSEQVGTVYRISREIADFLKVKHTDAFVPDRHQCVKKVAAG